MAERIPCPNCGRAISADLQIDVSANGYTAVHLGFRCKCCGSTYKDLAGHLVARGLLPIGAGEGE